MYLEAKIPAMCLKLAVYISKCLLQCMLVIIRFTYINQWLPTGATGTRGHLLKFVRHVGVNISSKPSGGPLGTVCNT